MQLSITHNQVYEEAQALKGMIANGVQGLIVEPSKSALPNPNMDLYREIRANGIPLVFFNAKYPWSDYPYVAMDDEAAGKIVTDYLFDCGHKRIFGMFALDDIQGHKRYGGFMKSCIEHNVRTAEKDVLWFATAERNAIFLYAQLKLLEMLHQSTAVVCYNDKLAINLLRFCRQQGIRVPEDISIVGIDDSKYSSICEVPLTTVRHPHQVLGEAAAKMLIEQMNSASLRQEDTIFVPDLVVRDSVRKLNTSDNDAKDHAFMEE
jgi:GntR family transcriptional regulator of arabinose operon